MRGMSYFLMACSCSLVVTQRPKQQTPMDVLGRSLLLLVSSGLYRRGLLCQSDWRGVRLLGRIYATTMVLPLLWPRRITVSKTDRKSTRLNSSHVANSYP